MFGRWMDGQVSPAHHGEQAAYQCGLDELELLGTPYFDALLIHWPGVQKKKVRI